MHDQKNVLRAGVEPATYGFQLLILQSTALPTELPKVTRNWIVESVALFDWADSRINNKLLLKLWLLTKQVPDTAGSLKICSFVIR
jgi:hypothetical protein